MKRTIFALILFIILQSCVSQRVAKCPTYSSINGIIVDTDLTLNSRGNVVSR